MSENNDTIQGISGDDELIGGSGTDSFRISPDKDDKTKLVVIGEFRAGKTAFIHDCLVDLEAAKNLYDEKETVQLQLGEVYKRVELPKYVLESNLEKLEESEYSAELDETFTQLHEADDRIAETRQNTMRLGIETRSMLDDLRKQLG